MNMSSQTKKRGRCVVAEPVKSSPNKTKKWRKSLSNENFLDEGIDMDNSDCTSAPSSSSSKPKVNNGRVKEKKLRTTPTKRKERGKKVSLKTTKSTDVSTMDVAQLLALGEGNKPIADLQTSQLASDLEDSDSELSDWEEVKDVEKKEPIIPKEGVNITIEAPHQFPHKRKKNRGLDVEALIKKQINKVKRDLQLLMHKVHVLCWIGHLKFVNQILNSQFLMGVSMSLVTSKNLYPPKYADLNYLEKVLKWFCGVIELKEKVKKGDAPVELLQELSQQFSSKVAHSKRDLIFLFIVFLRSLGLQARVVMSLQVVPVRPQMSAVSHESKKVQKKTSAKKIVNSDKTDVNNEHVEKSHKLECSEKKGKLSAKESDNIKDVKLKKSSNVKSSDANTPSTSDCQSESVFFTKNPKSVELKHALLRKRKVGNSSTPTKVKKEMGLDVSDGDEDDIKNFRDSPRVSKIQRKNTQEVKTEEPCPSPSKTSKPQNNTPQRLQGSNVRSRNPKIAARQDPAVKGQGNIKRTSKGKTMGTPIDVKSVKRETISQGENSSDTDSDFHPKSLLKSSSKKEIDRRILSSDEEEVVKKKQGVDVWTEVFLEAEEKWITVDVIKQKVHCVNELHARATQPVAYILACNNDSSIKDVTKRYSTNWHSDTRKRRVDDEWFNETLWPYLPPRNARDKEEDEDINRQLMDKPLPTVIGEYKDHPLYALKRHLLKFEAIYPPNAPTLGFVRGEPVYARECVVTLRSRDIWFREARIVRLNETPYKIVKSRPKFDRMTGEFKKDMPLELFGIWQTEDYMPPIAVDGKVPRNEYGNVYLFKPCMLPKGTVHLQIPGVIRVAKKLDIDCAAAVTGFEFHSGGCHPVLDGFVICEEFKEVLLDAWNKEIDESAKREEEKRDKRVYGNWRRLIRGLFIREKLKIKYSFGENSDEALPAKSSNTKKSKSTKN